MDIQWEGERLSDKSTTFYFYNTTILCLSLSLCIYNELSKWIQISFLNLVLSNKGNFNIIIQSSKGQRPFQSFKSKIFLFLYLYGQRKVLFTFFLISRKCYKRRSDMVEVLGGSRKCYVLKRSVKTISFHNISQPHFFKLFFLLWWKFKSLL